MKSYNEIADSILSRRDKYDEARKAKKKNIIRIASFAGCFVVAAVLGAGIMKGGWFDFNSLLKAEPTSQAGDKAESATDSQIQESTTDNITTQQQQTTKATPPTTEQPTLGQNVQTPPDEGALSVDGSQLWMIPALPFDRSFELTGEEITDEEAKKYFDENREGIVGSLSASGVPVDNTDIRITDKGYCHVYYDGTEGKSFEVRQNYRDYLVYVGEEEELAAIITLFKEDGELCSTPMFGAAWFEGYGDYLKEHKGEKLVYVYATFYEIIIAPDNTYFNPMGIDYNAEGLDITGKYLEGVDEPYKVFYHESATYIP